MVKWWVAEEHSETAAVLLGDRFDRLAPDLLLPELGNVLLKKVRLGELSSDDAAAALERTSLITSRHSAGRLVQKAWSVAVEFRQTMYDATYVALALAEGCQLVTADRRLYDALNAHVTGTMLWIGDLPEAP